FMGPSLWTADPAYFGVTNPEAVDYLTNLFGQYVDLGSHLDMLHESPLCMGMAWDTENVYWVFDGYDNVIVRYDFADDHDIGYDDHSDGIISRVVDAEVSRVPDVPSHMILDHDTGLLYTADTGNNRITVLDTNSGEEGGSLRSQERGVDHHEWVDVDYSTLISGEDVDGMDLPSGIALVDGTLLVTDNQNGTIIAFDLDGSEVARLDLELEAGALMGIEARSLSDIWVTDAIGNQVLRIQN
ncbi:MAG: sugar lactone lactonase YvrE, partial [Myxococcota bacterium]